MESIIRDHIITHYVRNDIFSKQQYGFLKGRNTVIQLIKMFDQWSDSLEVGGQIDVIYTDLEQESPAIADKPARRESLPKIAPIRRVYNVVADNTGLSSCV